MPANLLALAAGGLASLMLGDWIPLAAAAGGSALYLGLLSTAPSFRRAVRSNFDAQTSIGVASDQDAEALLADLSPSQRQHYGVLHSLRDSILERYRRLPGGRVLAAGSEGRLDALLANFLRLVSTLNGYRQFLNSADRQTLEAELLQLKAEAANDTSEALRDVKQRRIDILQRRVQRYLQAEESREVVSHQLASIEDMLRLTLEQAIAVRDPAGATEQLNALTAEVAATEETVRELEQFMHISPEYPASELPAPPRTRVR